MIVRYMIIKAELVE